MDPLILGTNGHVTAIDPATGKRLWLAQLKTGSLISSTTREDVSVLVRGTIVFAGCAGHVFCIDANTGEILWHNPLDGLGHNDVSLAMEGVSVQFLTKVERQHS